MSHINNLEFNYKYPETTFSLTHSLVRKAIKRRKGQFNEYSIKNAGQWFARKEK